MFRDGWKQSHIHPALGLFIYMTVVDLCSEDLHSPTRFWAKMHNPSPHFFYFFCLGQIRSSNVKRFGIVFDKFRNRKNGFDDKVMLVSCGLWKYPSVVLLN